MDLGGSLCATVPPDSDDVPLYRQDFDGVTYRFRFDATGMALVVDTLPQLRALAGNPAKQAELLSILNPPRLELWHADALYWAQWLAQANF